MKDFRDSDWSVNVWGAEGEVSITHAKAGVVTDHWPFIQREADTPAEATKAAPAKSIAEVKKARNRR